MRFRLRRGAFTRSRRRPGSRTGRGPSQDRGNHMHEVGVIQDALDVALDHAGRATASRIHRLILRVGPLSGVVPEALAFAFEVVTRGTIADGARLEVEHVPIICYCPVCQEEFSPDGWVFDCPHCGRLTSEDRQGHELELASVEMS